MNGQIDLTQEQVAELKTLLNKFNTISVHLSPEWASDNVVVRICGANITGANIEQGYIKLSTNNLIGA